MVDQAHSRSLALTADIVAAFVSNNSVRPAELAELIASVNLSLRNTGNGASQTPEIPKPASAVQIKKSVTNDYLICLEDGKKFRSLKRHLTGFGMTPNEYRSKWGLPADYPMVAPGYAAKRSELARAIGLGRTPRKT